jgi:flagellar basal body-associated protein FliL
MADSWTESRKKRKSWGFFFLGAVLVVVVLIFLQNNYGIFSSLSRQLEHEPAFTLSTDSTVGPHPVADKSITDQPDLTHNPDKPVGSESQSAAHSEENPTVMLLPGAMQSGVEVRDSSAVHTIFRNAADAAPEAISHSVSVANIRCRLAGAEQQEVLVSLRMIFHSLSLQDEVLLKRDEIRVIVQKVFSQKVLDEIQVNMLRVELKQSINDLLDGNKIDDVEFEDFRPTGM